MTSSSLDTFLAESRERIDRHLDELLPRASASPAMLHEAMRYAVFSGGKRLRPALAFAAARACGGDPARALPIAAAVELLHTYSLVHDDLPAMDDDSERRGQPTVHVKFGEALAVLAGDALLTEAFAVLARAGTCPEVAASLARSSGSLGLVGGQADDLGLAPEQASFDALVSIHRRKTAALFEAAVEGGARVCDASAPALERLARFAQAYGLAFQASDDLLDQGRKETSLLQVLDAAAVRRYVARHVTTAVDALETFGAAARELRMLAERIEERLV
jgi:geranylgeranyl diphosphate synthase, type II